MASVMKAEATNHSGWTGGDGRVYNDSECRYYTGEPPNRYYCYTYGLGLVGTETIDGVYVEVLAGGVAGSGEGNSVIFQLCNTTTLRGNPQSRLAEVDIEGNCDGVLYYNRGGSTDKWGLSQANIDAYVHASDFGVSIIQDNDLIDEWYMDGFQVTVYYTEAAGYANSVNTIIPANIASVSEILTANINTINEV